MSERDGISNPESMTCCFFMTLNMMVNVIVYTALWQRGPYIWLYKWPELLSRESCDEKKAAVPCLSTRGRVARQCIMHGGEWPPFRADPPSLSCTKCGSCRDPPEGLQFFKKASSAHSVFITSMAAMMAQTAVFHDDAGGNDHQRTENSLFHLGGFRFN